MALIITQIKSDVSESTEKIIHKAIKKAGLSQADIVRSEVYKTSLDARKHNDIHFVNSVYVELSDKEKEQKICDNCSFCQYISNDFEEPVICRGKYKGKIAIVGFGPAGLFCALLLSMKGYRPLIFERGGSVDERTASVKKFWSEGVLDTDSNVQFGEGGAGTFSDGKLTTRIKDPFCRYVLKSLVEFGAPPEILTKAKPHIGTDKLREVIKAIRQYIIENGGKIYFNTTVTDFDVSFGKIKTLHTTKGNFDVAAAVFAVGNSARDTFELLYNKQIMMQPKPFSVGVRIEHLQEDVNESLYGKYKSNPLLPAGEYQLSHRLKDGRCAYTFCMCPGGTVVASSSEYDTVVTNGMSEFARDGKNANAALVVSVSEKDFGNSVLDGMNFARAIEKKAYELAGRDYKAPASTVRGFLSGRPDLKTNIIPTYQRGLAECDFNKLFPSYICDTLKVGLNNFSRKMVCFGDENAVMTAPETRTSSPLRILRGEDLCSPDISNLYPCGEGAGYAGGIMSAAVDGIRTAYEIMKNYSPD